jgi:ABC-type sulfate transport system permease component
VTSDKRIAIGKRITAVAAVLAVVWGLVFVYTMAKIVRSPAHPARETGHIVPWSNHGFMHYATRFDMNMLDGTVYAAGIVIAVAFVGLPLYRGRDMFNQR